MESLEKKGTWAHGYPIVNLGRGNRYAVHTLVLTAFVGPRPPATECRHLDNNPGNCHLENLCWGSSGDNTEDQRRAGHLVGGERHGMHKFTNEQINEIHGLAGSMTQQAIADIFGASQGYISEIISNKKRTPDSHAGRGLKHKDRSI